MTDSRMFVHLVEENEWEGETWRFWLQTNGNGPALERLAAYLERTRPASEPYTMDPLEKAIGEADVDLLVRYADDDGYMASEIKVTGTLTLPENLDALQPDDLLYKGQIKNLFHDADPVP